MQMALSSKAKKVNEEVMEYARQSGKPILEYQTPETFADACNEFYDKVWETEQKVNKITKENYESEVFRRSAIDSNPYFLWLR